MPNSSLRRWASLSRVTSRKVAIIPSICLVSFSSLLRVATSILPLTHIVNSIFSPASGEDSPVLVSLSNWMFFFQRTSGQIVWISCPTRDVPGRPTIRPAAALAMTIRPPGSLTITPSDREPNTALIGSSCPLTTSPLSEGTSSFVKGSRVGEADSVLAS